MALKVTTASASKTRRVAITAAAVLTCLGISPLPKNLETNARAQSPSPQCSNKVADENGAGVTRKAVIMEKPNAEMTDEARRNKVEGLVVLSIVLNASGDVTDIATVEGLPDGLTEAAAHAAEQIKFKPALKDGCPVSQRLKVQYEFRVK